MSFKSRVRSYVERVENQLESCLPKADDIPIQLHAAMRHAVFNGGKRLRPLLAYATGEVLEIPPERIDSVAVAVELIHCYSLVHDDLPAMDDDDLRRGQPTVHRAFDDATAILAGDALQGLAFEALASSGYDGSQEAVKLLARAAGSRGMAGGQALDLQFESTCPDRETLEKMFKLKTGALLSTTVMMAAALGSRVPADVADNLKRFGECIGIAFQIKDDLLDIEGETRVIGKPAGSDLVQHKATWPGLFGLQAARERIDELMDETRECLNRLPGDTEPLNWLAERIVSRDH
ncbi:MAG: polyprenyl synthetase family protein [Wenzhouxiangella sp.]